MIFDPTPGNDTDLYTGFNLITGTIEYLRYRWNRYVVEFNVNDQRSILKNIGNRSEKLNFNFISKLKTQNTRTYFTIISGILFLLIVYNLLKNRFAFTSNAKRNSIASETYIKSLKLMQKKGIKKMPDMTSNEFKEYVQSKSQNGYKEFTIITDIYNETKFSGSNDKNLLKKLGDSYKNLRKKL